MNLPTKITVARLALIPLFLVCFCLQGLWEYMYIITALVFILASTTDFVDGHIARKYNMVTSLGKFLDPIADKVLVVAGLFVLVQGDYIPTPYVAMICAIVIMARELIIGLFRQIAALQNYVLAADKLGKIKTVLTLSAMSWLLFAPPTCRPFGDTVYKVVMIIGYIQFVLATVMTVVSGLHYLIANKQLLQTDAESAQKSEQTAQDDQNVAEQSEVANS